MSLGLIVRSGRILTARLLLGAAVGGLSHCAIGDGDETFVDPINPPDPSVDQIALRHELARKRFYKRTFLVEDPDGPIVLPGQPPPDSDDPGAPSGTRYSETGIPTETIGIFFRFEEHEANGLTVKEYGFFGGDVAYVPGWTSDYARDGLFHPTTNPDGQVLRLGDLYEVKTIPDFHKTSDTRLELVGILQL